ncbi:hypothetical protein DEJ25_09710 [Curtobacterium sp. MCPF17_011]|uniref:hypothetical protein n=1 Tax=Curtobacterium sp. MCPF17_011 TaxID=2175652 RepID=UPI000DA6F23B|nr:hypothetical protein [Curtobacterium sp. MCPF17_011]PZF12093.1 hypothetical protein DEJ25_09710 [Curtobacterium sp. MCPF17_011]
MGAVAVKGGNPIEVSAAVGSVELMVSALVTRLDSNQARRLAVCLIEAASDADNPTTADWP